MTFHPSRRKVESVLASLAAPARCGGRGLRAAPPPSSVSQVEKTHSFRLLQHPELPVGNRKPILPNEIKAAAGSQGEETQMRLAANASCLPAAAPLIRRNLSQRHALQRVTWLKSVHEAPGTSRGSRNLQEFQEPPGVPGVVGVFSRLTTRGLQTPPHTRLQPLKSNFCLEFWCV